MRILLLSTADTDLLAARASGADYRLANPARVAADAVPALLDGVHLAVVRLLGGRQAWPDGLATVLASGVPTVVLGGEPVPDAELMAASTVPSGVATEALAYLVEGGPANLAQLARFLSDTVLLTGEGFAPPAPTPAYGGYGEEEGELRPQLLDRFGLTVEVDASRDPAVRVEVGRRRLAADADPVGFAARWAAADAEIARRVAAARRRLDGVRLPDAALRQIAEVCAAFDVDGMRADIVTARTALAHAAWHGRDAVTVADVRVAARLALPHRRRRDPFDTPGLDEQRLDEALDRAGGDDPDDDQGGSGGPDGGPDSDPGGGGPVGRGSGGPNGGPGGGSVPDDGDAGGSVPAGVHPPGLGRDGETGRPGAGPAVAVPRQELKARLLTAPGVGDGVPGRRSRARTGRGRTTGARVPAGRAGALHLPATVRAAAGDRPLDRAAYAAARLAATGAPCVVVDCESGPVRLGLARRLAAHLAADHHRLDQIAAVPLTHLTTHPRDRAGRVPA